jgi:hypothetical protein
MKKEVKIQAFYDDEEWTAEEIIALFTDGIHKQVAKTKSRAFVNGICEKLKAYIKELK